MAALQGTWEWAVGRGKARASEPRDLREVLDDHRLWIESEGAAGRRAELRGADLAEADLSDARLPGADLSGADLQGANLEGADLNSADLAGANLAGANLRRARVRGANLRDAFLQDADLSDTLGLLPGQLGGANVAGASLPETVAGFEGLANVAEASKIAQGLFTSLLFVSSYAWLTIASTTDVQLLNNAAPPSSRLPILGTDIPLVRFYMVAPLLLLALYVYFHLCLQRLWEELAELPAVFPDGKSLDRKAYPWLMNALVRSAAPRLREGRSHLAKWQSGMSILLAWGLVPVTLLVFWGRYLRAHDWQVTGLHIALVAAAIGVGAGFLRLAGSTLTGAERRPFRWRRAWRDARTRSMAVAVGLGAVLLVLSFGALEGVNPRLLDDGIALTVTKRDHTDLRHLIPRAFAAVGFLPYAQLEDANVSPKPANWSGSKATTATDAPTHPLLKRLAGESAPASGSDIAQVKGADLEGRDLRYCQAYGAFFVNAYLKRADLRGSDLRAVDFRGADLREADLRGVNLREADLQGADLRWARLDGAKLRDAKLRDAQFRETDLRGVDLQGADVRGANLSETFNLSADQLATAITDRQTRLPAYLTRMARSDRRRD